MIGMKARTSFRARQVRKRAQAASFTSLGHAGAAIRLTARRSIKRRTTPSAPGTPPHTRAGALKNALLYAVEKQPLRVVIGPVASMVGRSASAHEFGGRFRGQRYPARPFMGPALLKNLKRLPKHWRGSVR